MISLQDMEDFRQDAEILVLLGNCKHSEVSGFKTNVIINKRQATRSQLLRRTEILKDYKYYTENLVNFADEDLIFKVCKYVEYLPKNQRTAVLNFLKYGNNAVVASKTGEAYNTVKANFRHAVLKLRDLLEGEK